ncbi:MAG: nicotinate-nucleotide adenylyltransferase [Sedimenticolaceae bacterium]|nr:nicotinate-nucleotide adenylyltransferase [Sedimenticolaceae bacterium]
MIGVFGGTFDPVHNGHLRTALDVQEALGIRRIHFVPLKEAVHRDQPGTSAELRCALVQAAVADQPGFIMDNRELHREGPSWSYHTLESFRREYPDEPLCFLMGGDAFNGYLQWHRPLEILELAHLVVMQRPDASRPGGELAALLDRRQTGEAGDLHASPAGRIFLQPVTQLDISASDIRQRIAVGRSARFLVPEQVLGIIQQLRLYEDA